jgi:RimJ/RimL family protein N-acetyltransferase
MNLESMQLVEIPRDGAVVLPGVALPEAARPVITQTVRLYERRGFVVPWTGYLAVAGAACVGCCGFASPPVENTVEIAYGTFPEFQNRGVATQLARRLVDIALATNSSVKIIAHTLMEENASAHILRKIGFAFAGPVNHPEDGWIWKWRYEPRLETPGTAS